jgi:predicted transcriptional regulator
MSETKRNWREDLKVFRQRMGLTEVKKSWAKNQRDTMKAIREALKNGPQTIPEIAGRANLPGDKVVWYVMAMKRYGQVAEVGQAGDCYRYELKEAQ